LTERLSKDDAVWTYVPIVVASALADDQAAYKKLAPQILPSVERMSSEARPAWAWSWLSFAAAVMKDADGYFKAKQKYQDRLGLLEGAGHFEEEVMARGIGLLAEARWEETGQSAVQNPKASKPEGGINLPAALLPVIYVALIVMGAPAWVVSAGFIAGLISPFVLFKGPRAVVAKLFRRSPPRASPSTTDRAPAEGRERTRLAA
jgi:hypothetical protein